MRVASLAALIAVLAVRSAAGQVLIRGGVLDADTGQPLIAATVQVEGRSIGAVTNADGEFSLGVTGLPVVMVIRHIGYRSRRLPVAEPPEQGLRIALEPDPVQLEGVVVSGEDPGVRLVRRALDRKAAWRDTVRTAYAEVYSRFMLYSEFQAVQLEETIGSSWWKAGEGVREITRARRLRPPRRERYLYARIRAVPNLYDDEVVVGGTRYRGPLHPDAERYYNFKLSGQRSQDGRVIHDVAYTPGDLSMAGFVGTMAIQDSTWDVLSVTARPVVGRVGIPPVLERTVRMEQRFDRRGGAMIPVYFAADGWVRVGRAGVSYPVARYRQVSGLSLHATRIPVPDSLFESPRVVRDDPAIRAGNWLFDWNPGMIPLSADEERDIASLRADRTLAQYFRPFGLLANYAAVPVSAPRLSPETSAERRASWMRPWVWYNRVDGWHVGLKPELPAGRAWTLLPALAWDEARGRLSWSSTASWDPGERLRAEFGAERFTAVTGVGSRRDRFLPGLATYAGYDDYFDYYDRARRWAGIGVTLGGTRVQAAIAHEQHRSASRNDEYDGWLKKNEQRANPPIEDGRLASASLRFTAGEPEMVEPRLDGFIDLRGEAARAGILGSDFGFLRWQGAASVRIPTFARRRIVPPTLRLDVVAGGGTDGVPVQREGVLDVATGPVAGAVGFRSRRDARLTARQWLAVFWQHDFGSLLNERLGLGETRLGLMVFGAHGSAWSGALDRRDEVGLALSRPFNLPIRINLASRLGELSPLVTVEYYGLGQKLLRR